MRLPPAFGRSFAASGVLLAFGLAAPLAAQPARRAPRAEAIVDEMAAPRREGYDRIVTQLPPLTPVRHGAQKAEPAVAATAESPAASEAQASAAVAVDPRPERAPQPEPALQTEAPPAPAQPVPETAAEAAASAPPATAAEPAPVARSAPAEPAPEAEPAPVAEPAPLVETAAPPAAEAEDAPPAAESTVAAPVETPNVAEQPAPVAELPPPAAIPIEEEPSTWTDWALLLAFVAIGGLFAARRWKARRRPAPAAASVVAPPSAAAAKRGRLAAALVIIRETGVPAALALLSRLRNLRRRKPASERDAEKVAEWAQISATLRARANSAVASAPQPEEGPGVVSEPPTAKADARRWDQDQDGVELLEPGSPGARALVMNARRKLQTAGQR